MYVLNTVGVASLMRFIGKQAAVTNNAAGTVQMVWTGLIVWNIARFLEEGLRIAFRGKKLVGVPAKAVVQDNSKSAEAGS